MKKSFWFLIILTLLVVVFSVQNAESVLVRFAVWQGEISLAIVMILAFLVGLIVGAIYVYFSMRKKKKVKEIGDVAFEKEIPREVIETDESEM